MTRVQLLPWRAVLQVLAVLSLSLLVLIPGEHTWPWGTVAATLWAVILWTGGSIRHIPAYAALLLLALMGSVGVWVAGGDVLAWQGFGYLWISLVLIVLVANWQGSPWWLVWGVGLASAALALSLPFFGGDLHQRFQPLPALVYIPINKNIASGLIAPGIPCLIGAGWQVRKVWRPSVWVLTIASTLMLIAIGSRGAFLGLLLTLALGWCMAGLRLRQPWRIVATLATVSLVAVTLGLIIFSPKYVDFGFDRVEIWQRAAWLIADFPFTGAGLGQFRVVVPLLYPYLLAENAQPVIHAHNLWLQVGADLGLPGLIAYVTLFIIAARHIWQVWQVDGRSRALAFAVIGMLTVIIGHGLVDAVAWGQKPALLTALALGLGLRKDEG